MTAPLNTASLVSSWREAMEGVTPGPWISLEPASSQYVVNAPAAGEDVCQISPWSQEQDKNDAAWIARCSPSGISALLDALESTSRALSEKEGELAEADGEITSSHCLIAEERQMRFAAEHERDEALAALKASEEREVQKLVWDETFVDRGDGAKDHSGWEAPNGFGLYYTIEMYFGSDSYGWQVEYDGRVISDHDDPEAAKASA